MRFDKVISRIISPFFKTQKKAIPVLMYHGISEDKRFQGHPYYETTTSPKRFNEQIRYLYENNYRTVTLSTLHKYLDDREIDGQGTPVLITFDDGLECFYETASVILEKYGFSAVNFLPAGLIGENDRKSFMGHRCMTWSEVRQLRGRGFEFGSHSLSHTLLYAKNKKELESELIDSRLLIESNIDCDIDSFSYPFAFPNFDKKFILHYKDALKRANYTSGFTTNLGISARGSDSLTVRRLPINDYDDEELLHIKLKGAYNWLYYPQVIFKYLKNIRLLLKSIHN